MNTREKNAYRKWVSIPTLWCSVLVWSKRLILLKSVALCSQMLWLGLPLCHPHPCQHCGIEVDSLATHGFSCRWSEGRHFRHNSINKVIHRSLASAHILSLLEPTDRCALDGLRLDGITLVPWKRRKALIWDVTCPNTYAPSYTARATSEVKCRKTEEGEISTALIKLSLHASGGGDIWGLWSRGSKIPQGLRSPPPSGHRGGKRLPVPTTVNFSGCPAW